MRTVSQSPILKARQATFRDAADLGFIQVASMQSAFHQIVPAAFLESLSLTETIETWQKRLASESTHAWLVQTDGEVRGFIRWGESRDMDEEPGSTAEIFDMHVIPSAVGQGLGSLLLNCALSEAMVDGYGECTVWLLKQNHYARTFYEERSFEDERQDGHVLFNNYPINILRYRTTLV